MTPQPNAPQPAETVRRSDLMATACLELAMQELPKAQDGLEKYFTHHVAEHDDGCPEDDTCDCPLVLGINGADNRIRLVMQAIEAWDRSRPAPPAEPPAAGEVLPTSPGIWLSSIHTKVVYLVTREEDRCYLEAQRINPDNGCFDRHPECVDTLTKGHWRRLSLTPATDAAREVEQLKDDNHRLRLGDMSVIDYERLVEWIKNPKRKDPSGAFTAGAARTAAIAIQDSGVLAQIATANAKLAEVEGRLEEAKAIMLAIRKVVGLVPGDGVSLLGFIQDKWKHFKRAAIEHSVIPGSSSEHDIANVKCKLCGRQECGEQLLIHAEDCPLAATSPPASGQGVDGGN